MPKQGKPDVAAQPIAPLWVLALLSGFLLAAAFPPFDCKGLVWLGLAPLIAACVCSRSPWQAARVGFMAGFVFFLFNLHPLVSAHSWTGWAAETTEAFARRMTRQWWFMQGIWLAFVVLCAFWWAAWAGLCRKLCREKPWHLLILAPSLWIVLAEALRARTTFGFAWGFLGNALADNATLRQLAAVGGALLLSVLVVVANIGLSFLFIKNSNQSRRISAVAAAFCLAAAWVFGANRLGQEAVPGGDPITVAVIQHSKTSYNTDDFSIIGLDRNYQPLTQQALSKKAGLVVLPESIALGALSLDGSRSLTKPVQWQHTRALWDKQITQQLAGTSSVLVLGVDTVEKGLDHNTLVAWDSQKTLGWYHKRQLVPFAEYEPWPWAPWAIRGKSQYHPGQGPQLIRLPNGVALGGFICQEVLFPWVTRQSAQAGATALVTGGNDGVFGDAAVAQVHADCAQIRAVETGRYIIRAMKTGISSIIDPSGRELVRSQAAEPVLFVERIVPISTQTLYTRFGDWVVMLAGCILLVAVVLRSHV